MADAKRIQLDDPTTVRLRQDQTPKVRKAAKREGRSVGALIRDLIDEAFAARKAADGNDRAA